MTPKHDSNYAKRERHCSHPCKCHITDLSRVTCKAAYSVVHLAEGTTAVGWTGEAGQVTFIWVRVTYVRQNTNKLNLSNFSQSMTMNSDECRNPMQALSLLTWLPSGGGEGLLGKQIKPTVCKIPELISTNPRRMLYAQLRNHYMVDWLHPCTSARARHNSSDSCP